MQHQLSDETSSAPNGFTNPSHEQAAEVDEVLGRISDGFFAVDHQWRITYVNRQMETILSANRDDFLHRNLWKCYPTLHGTVFEEQFHRALNEKTTVRFEWFTPIYQRFLEVTAYPSNTGLSVFVRDITEQKRAQEALLLSNERFRLAAKNDAIYDWDIKSNHIFWGEGLAALFGYTSDQLQIQAWEAALHHKERDDVLSDLFRILNDPKAMFWDREYRIRKKDGVFCFAYERGYIIRDQSKTAVRMVGVMQNITERKLLQQQLEEQQKKTTAAVIQAQEQERSQIGRELHDNVNQVLTTVKLYQELLFSGVGDRNELLLKSSQLLQQSIDAIRDISQRLSAPTIGKMTLNDSVKELLGFIRSTNKFTVEENTTVLRELPIDDELHLAIYRILQEQLTNVLKYAEATFVRVSFTRASNCLILEVTDNGKGFDPKQKRRGIGIANMQLRAESLNGTFIIDSAPGRGCRMTVRFPLKM